MTLVPPPFAYLHTQQTKLTPRPFVQPFRKTSAIDDTKNDSSLYTSSKNSAATVYALYEMSLNRIKNTHGRARCDM